MVHEDLISTDHIPWLSRNNVEVYVLRTDKTHPVISGNKWFKLRYYIKDALHLSKKQIITFGGAFSNHIVATAAAAKASGLKSTGIIRGEKPAKLSPTLLEAMTYDMELRFISRFDFAQKTLPVDLITNTENYFINEGGYGKLGAKGAATIPYNKETFDYICCAVGTGTMLAGLINNKKDNAEVIGFSVLKNYADHEHEILELLASPTQAINIIADFHFGGYAKATDDLLHFMNTLYKNTGIPTDFVYTAKLFYGVRSLIEQGYFKEGKSVLIIHSGGLQGNRSLPINKLVF